MLDEAEDHELEAEVTGLLASVSGSATPFPAIGRLVWSVAKPCTLPNATLRAIDRLGGECEDRVREMVISFPKSMRHARRIARMKRVSGAFVLIAVLVLLVALVRLLLLYRDS
jgi:hypothetical protein